MAEKTGGRVPASTVVSISIDDLRLGGPDAVIARLTAIPPAGVAIVNIVAPGDFAGLT